MGILSDMYGRKVGFAADSLMGTAVPCLCLALTLLSARLSHEEESSTPVLVLSWLRGFAGCAISVASASIGDALPKERRAEYAGYLMATMFAGMGLGYGAQKAVYEPLLQRQAASAIHGAILSIFNAALMWCTVSETNPRSSSPETAKVDDSTALSVGKLLMDKSLLTMFAVTLLQFLAYATFDATSAKDIRQYFGLSEDGNNFFFGLGTMVSMVFAFTLLGPLVSCWGIRRSLALGHFLRGLGVFLFLFFVGVISGAKGDRNFLEHNQIVWYAFSIAETRFVALIMVGEQIVFATANAFLTMLVPQKSRGGAIGFNRCCEACGRIVGPYLGLKMYASGMKQTPLWSSVICSLTAVCIVIFGFRQIDAMDAQQVAARGPGQRLLSGSLIE